MTASPAAARETRLVIAGATGVLGNEVLRQLVGMGRYARTLVIAKEPIDSGLHGVDMHVVTGSDPSAWPLTPADAAVVLFDPPRLFYDRERALWTPAPEQLPALARWLRAGGVRSLAIVLPHVQMRLPDALKRGLATLDEHAVAAEKFDRLLIVRSAQKANAQTGGNLLVRIARFMLGVGKYMIPGSEQPVRAVKVAQFVSAALQIAPAGTHVAAPEVVWEAAQGDTREAVAHWLGC